MDLGMQMSNGESSGGVLERAYRPWMIRAKQPIGRFCVSVGELYDHYAVVSGTSRPGPTLRGYVIWAMARLDER